MSESTTEISPVHPSEAGDEVRTPRTTPRGIITAARHMLNGTKAKTVLTEIGRSKPR